MVYIDIHVYYPSTMWDTQPLLYWRVKQDGKWTWQKAKAAMTQMGLYAIEPPVLKVNESEGESE